MPTLADVLKASPQTLTAGKFEVATTSPFEVYIDGGTVAHPANAIGSITYSVGDTGLYLLIQGQQPWCLPGV
jgi:hypothetical protein